jgi:spermidine synthase
LSQFVLGIIYILFFSSGAAALMYEVVWVRSLSLIFGGTHLAVTTVLSVFMGGLALGSFIIGRRVDRMKKPLRLYGFLEIALFAVIFIVLMKIYPSVYSFLVRGEQGSRFYLSFVRVMFAFVALIIPTTLMGGTLPVLTRFVSRHPQKLGTHLSLLYGFNTLGAVAGTAAAGFFFLRFYSVSATLYAAILINSVIGLVSIVLSDKASVMFDHPDTGAEGAGKGLNDKSPDLVPEMDAFKNLFSLRLVLLGIGISGFCALGYEVLWTRILTLTIGTSVYGFTIMLVAFLTGIALGSKAYGLFKKILPGKMDGMEKRVIGFGIVQCVIGVTALVVTFYIRDLPVNSTKLRELFLNMGLGVFDARQLANLALAFCYMVVPAFFMGLAFPIAGEVNIGYKRKVGYAVGGVLAYNTIGAILGSAVSGYLMIYVFGIERSLQLLTIVNVGIGLMVIFSIKNSKALNWGIAGLASASLVFLALSPGALRMWNMKYFAIFQNNQPEAYNTPQKKQDAIENTDVLFYHEGVDSTISSIKVKGGNQALLVNGKVVASAALRDQQCQLTLGHLPMLFHKSPKKVLVIGLGTGMTLGATSIHPTVEELTLVEIEPEVTGAARTFDKYNNAVLDNPILNVIYNDGRNFLLTTRSKYDVITADPIHPWTQGSGYLYTTGYFKLASEHLLPGGIMCQWLPIYEMSVDDIKSVVNTFSQHFKYTMTWLTQYDAELIGSNSPFMINEEELDDRIAFPPIAKGLERVMMGSATDFLSYFLMGTDAMRAFGEGGVVNTDDNLYLEFSSPESVGKNVMGTNVSALARYRESILPYLLPASDGKKRREQEMKWQDNFRAAWVADQAHAKFLDGQIRTPEFHFLMSVMDNKYSEFSPGRFLKQEYDYEVAKFPTLLREATFLFLNEKGAIVEKKVSAVLSRVSDVRAAVVFVDNTERVIYGKIYFSGDDLDAKLNKFVEDAILDIQALYRKDTQNALGKGEKFPPLESTMLKIKEIIEVKCRK